MKDLTRLFLSLSGPFAQQDAVGASLFVAAGVTGARALPGPAASVTSSAPLACKSGSVPTSGGATPVSAASAPGSSGRHERTLESPRSERCRRRSSSGGGPVRVRSVTEVGLPPLLALPVRLVCPLLLRLQANRKPQCLLLLLGVLALVEAKRNVQDLLSLCHSLRIVINENSDLVPLHTANYLGMTIDTGAARIFPSLARVEKFLSVAETFCTLSAPPAQLWQVVLGHLAVLERLVPHSCLRMRSLQWYLKAHWSPENDPPSLPVPLSREVREDLSWWMMRDHLLKGVRFGTSAPDLHLYSNASRSGWGAHLLDRSVSRVRSEEEKLLHINLHEMKAVFLALHSFQEVVAGRRVTAMCDNSMVVAYVNKQGGTVSRSLCSLASQLLRWTESLDIHLDARYLPGQSNVLADLLSRRDQVIGTEWSLHPQVTMDLLRRWGSPLIDLFATSLNAKLPLYCSLVLDSQAVFEDAFRHPWDGLGVYSFPPFPLVGRVVAWFRETPNLSMTLVAPLWPGKE